MEQRDLDVKGVSVNLPIALFGTSKEARCVYGVDGSVSNGHWAVFSGSPDLSIIRKATEKKANGGEIDWQKKGRTYTLADVKNQSWSNATDIKKHAQTLYYGKRYALAEDHAVLRGDGAMCGLHGYLPMTWVGENEYRPARKEMDAPYEAWMDPKYYFAFRKLGFEFLVGPGKWVKKTQKDRDETGQEIEVEVDVHEPQIILVVRCGPNPANPIYEVRGVIMPMKE